MNTIDIEDLRQREMRYREFKLHLEPFAKELGRIYSIMPYPFRYYLTGEVEEIIKPEWQELIDKIKSLRYEHIKRNFPEFINSLS